jgi:hypothetical protein
MSDFVGAQTEAKMAGAKKGHAGGNFSVVIKTKAHRDSEGKMKRSSGSPKVEKFGKGS